MEDTFLSYGIEPVATDEDPECSGGVYRCRDDISNFTFRIRVRKVNPVSGSSLSASTISLGAGEGGGPATDSNESLRSEGGHKLSLDDRGMEQEKGANGSGDLVEDLTIQW